ncbi:hypothetical protein PAESOLCIP111_01794 [Paenibacillus solanacearum]|uniref:HPt domain-containing protein n=1 Tax=Paenibacillus solanacearum TaxID=2048548 RepID=A0A916NWA5_9BACL|nr:hypothetical protein [Paenibacillus solanacearum]CAG7615259.1 hypothetical protein PAESOLCIP111_01794 [Paenibacillus solanacearum]
MSQAADTNEDKRRKMQRILARTRELFLGDARLRGAAVLEAAARWREGALPADRLGESAYAYAHALRGVALTVGCSRIHELSEEMITTSIQHSGDWNEEASRKLLRLLAALTEEVERESVRAEEGGMER